MSASKLLKLNFILLIFALALFFIHNSLFSVAQATDPLPKPYVPCSDNRLDEFHSLRPYQASPCGEAPGISKTSPTALLCGNDMEIKQTFTLGREQAETCTGNRCFYKIRPPVINISIDLSTAQLPILGNTELVANSQSPENKLSSGDRVNNYISWYLNGTLNRAESVPLGISPIDVRNLIDFSGPLNKLLPQRIQRNQREQTIAKAIASKEGNAETRHDQTVGCTLSGLIGMEIPIPCVDTDELLPEEAIKRIFIPGAIRITHLFKLSEWENNLPPKEENFERFEDYWKAYLQWRGNICTPSVEIFGKKLYVCANLAGGQPNFFAWLYPYIPFSTTEDKKALVEFYSDEYGPGEAKSQPDIVLQIDQPDIKITALHFDPEVTEHYLYFPHTAENAELGELLQKTYSPRDEKTYSGEDGDGVSPYNTGRCVLLDSRTNPGDDLFGEYHEDGKGDIRGGLNYEAEFYCDLKTSPTGQQYCEKEIHVIAGSVYTRTPFAEELWERLVNGSFSVFKKIYPKVGPGSPVTYIKDIPGVTKAIYKASDETSGGSLQSDLYFPHLGSLDEYFLKGIQTALRPKGFGDPTLSGVGSFPGSGTTDGGTGASPPPGNLGGGGCQRIDGDKPYCSVGYLSQPQFFGNSSKAGIASRICNAESHADAFVVRDTCESSGDVSVGLFQINIRAHSLKDPVTNETLVCPAAFEGGSASKVGNCKVVDQILKDKCINALRNYPDYQIQKAVEISSGGTNWNAWSTYKQYPGCRQP